MSGASSARAAVDPLDQPGGEAGERLVGLHGRQVGVDGDAEQVDDLLDHLAVLAGVDDQRLQAVGGAQARPRPGPS